jgi:hypothetical protein
MSGPQVADDVSDPNYCAHGLPGGDLCGQCVLADETDAWLEVHRVAKTEPASPTLTSKPVPPLPLGVGVLDYRKFPLETSVAIALMSGRLRGQKPLSMLIVAPPGWGKSYALEKYIGNHHVLGFNRGTSWGLLKEIIATMDATHEPVTHIVISDMTALLGGSKDVVGDFKATLSILTEEGVDKARSYTTDIDATRMKAVLPFANVKAGVVMAMTREDIETRFGTLRGEGFLSRFIPFSFAPTDDLKAEADEDILAEKPNVRFNLPATKLKTVVTCDSKIARSSKLWKRSKTPRESGIAYLALKATALLNHRTEVTAEDVAELDYVSQWWNYDYRPLGAGNPPPIDL